MKSLLFALYVLSANQAVYDGKNLIFSGQFQVEHPMGLLKAEQATLPDLQLHSTKPQHLILEQGASLTTYRKKSHITIQSDRALSDFPSPLLFSLFQFQEIQFYDDVKIDAELPGHHKSTAIELHAAGGSALYKAGLLTLYPTVPLSHCHLYHKAERIDAHTIRFDFLKEELLCEGEVRLISQREKESFAIADHLRIQCPQQILILSADPPHRVLFWQEDLVLSAPEVRIQRNPITQEETIYGKGDVHFTLNTQEQNLLNELLATYL